MRSHDRINSRLNCLSKRRQIDLTQALQIVIYQGYCQVRVGCSIPMTGKVLCGGQHSVGARAPDISRHQIAHLLRVASECACPDDRVSRVGIHVGNGKQVPVHTKRPAFLCRDSTESLRVSEVSRGPKSHRMRKYGRAKEPRRKHTALEIPSDQER